MSAVGEDIPYDDFRLFSESNSRFIVEVEPGNQHEFENQMNSVSFGHLGKTIESNEFIINGLNGNCIVETTLDKLKSAWQTPLHS